jgi:hypothetical protein
MQQLDKQTNKLSLTWINLGSAAVCMMVARSLLQDLFEELTQAGCVPELLGSLHAISITSMHVGYASQGLLHHVLGLSATGMLLLCLKNLKSAYAYRVASSIIWSPVCCRVETSCELVPSPVSNG